MRFPGLEVGHVTRLALHRGVHQVAVSLVSAAPKHRASPLLLLRLSFRVGHLLVLILALLRGFQIFQQLQ